MVSNSKFYRITALTLALLMFTTSVGLAVDMHYCGGQLKTISLFGKARTCYPVKKVKASRSDCPMHHQLKNNEQGCMVDKPDCCQNKSLHIQLDQDQNIKVEGPAISKPLPHFVATLIVTFLKDLNNDDQPKPVFAHYRPPLIPRDIPVLIQSFLL